MREVVRVRDGARLAVDRRVLVTTVRLRLSTDLAVFGDARLVVHRTYVRYPRPMALRWASAESDEAGALFPDEQAAQRHVGKGAYSGMEFLHVNARTIINEVPAESLVPFRFTINPYRGCSHACVYCFARPTHDYLGLGIGEDFERKIVVKINAVERLRAELRAPRWAGDPIAMGTNTDPYQHAEGKYHLTKGIVETLSTARNPFSILTKSTLILRDAALLAEASQRTEVVVSFSVGTLDRSVWRLTEPGTPPPERRIEALRRLTDLGIPCGVLVAPVLPGLSDSEEQLTEVVQACAAAGAVSIGGVALHLRGTVRGHYLEWLQGARPDLVTLHRRRFRRSAYQEDAERERVEGIVRRVAHRCGITGRDRYRATPRTTPDTPGTGPQAELPARPDQGTTQLRLL